MEIESYTLFHWLVELLCCYQNYNSLTIILKCSFSLNEVKPNFKAFQCFEQLLEKEKKCYKWKTTVPRNKHITINEGRSIRVHIWYFIWKCSLKYFIMLCELSTDKKGEYGEKILCKIKDKPFHQKSLNLLTYLDIN